MPNEPIPLQTEATIISFVCLMEVIRRVAAWLFVRFLLSSWVIVVYVPGKMMKPARRIQVKKLARIL